MPTSPKATLKRKLQLQCESDATKKDILGQRFAGREIVAVSDEKQVVVQYRAC